MAGGWGSRAQEHGEGKPGKEGEEGGADVTTRSYPSLWGGWDTAVVQISMKNCHTKGSDSALESLSLT